MRDGYVFSLAGVHGIGKTTLYSHLSKYFENHSNIRLFPERLRANPPVPFGSKNKQDAFRSEVHYTQQMIKRNELVKKFITKRRENIAILDRSPLSVLIYTRALGLPKIDRALIEDTFQSVPWQREYIFYLEADPKTIMRRIYQRGSLDSQRQKWNEEDFEYLNLVLAKYEEIFIEKEKKKKFHLTRIKTDEKTPQQVIDEIILLIEDISGIRIRSMVNVPSNQAKLTNWF